METRKDKDGRVLQKGEIQRKDGRYVYSYTDRIGKRIQIYANTLKELREKEKRAKLLQLVGVASSSMTVNDLCDLYLETRKDLRETTMRRYRYYYDRYVRGTFGTRRVQKVVHADVTAFYLYVAKEFGVATTTMGIIECVLKPAFTFAVRNDMLMRSPVDGALAEVAKQLNYKPIKHPSLTVSQMRAFFEYAKVHGRTTYPLLLFIAHTGLRIGEALALADDCVDLKNRRIYVRRTYVIGSKADDFVTNEPKTAAGNRCVPLTDTAYEALVAAINLRERRSPIKTGFIFRNSKGHIMDGFFIDRAIIRMVDGYNKEALKSGKPTELLPRFGVHVLRHTFCSRAYESGMSAKTLQTIVGHANITTTLNVYVDVDRDVINNEVERLSNHMSACCHPVVSTGT